MVKDELPFEVGQDAETKSFEDGFRGAWFRCKILDIKQKGGDISVQVDYYDYSDQKSTWTKLYQNPPFGRSGKKKKKQLMLRPHFPPLYRRTDKLEDSTTFAVLVNDEWKVGDLVDWLTDGCYWSATVTNILSDERVQIELLPPPEGEGSSYEASSKDLRPSLNWSIKSGWSVPVPTVANGSSHPCAQILTPFTKGKEVKRDDVVVDVSGGRRCSPPPGVGKYACPKPSCSSDSDAVAAKTTIKEEDGDDDNAQKKLKADHHHLNKSGDTLEAAIVDLEGLINQVKRFERLLKYSGIIGK